MPERTYEVVLGAHALDYISQLSDRPYGRVVSNLQLLAANPFLGRRYEPEYEVSLPPVEGRRLVVSRTSVELFYFVDEPSRKVVIFWADNCRSDPRQRFIGLHESDY